MHPFLLCAVGLGCCETSEHSTVHNLGINKINAYVFIKKNGVPCSTCTLVHHLAPDVELSLLARSFDIFFRFLFFCETDEEKQTIMSDGKELVLVSHLPLI